MYTYKIKLDRVVDGDTIDAYIDLGFDVSVKKRIRFMGINTPESRTRDLEGCKTIGLTDIAKNPDLATKHKIAVVPTIIIFKDGDEVARFQADLSFKMVATREEVQEEIDNQLMSDF